MVIKQFKFNMDGLMNWIVKIDSFLNVLFDNITKIFKKNLI